MPSRSGWRKEISIHAPRTGSDHGKQRPQKPSKHFNPRSPHGERRSQPSLLPMTLTISIHAPRTGSDLVDVFDGIRQLVFQSTLPARGATTACRTRRRKPANFNPRSPHGERPCRRCRCAAFRAYFNPRSPHGERHAGCVRKGETQYFNPRPPHGERRHRSAVSGCQRDFNPRSPHGERPPLREALQGKHGFQSTLPARGAT